MKQLLEFPGTPGKRSRKPHSRKQAIPISTTPGSMKINTAMDGKVINFSSRSLLLTGSEAGLNGVERFMFRRLPKALATVPPSLRRLVEHSIRHEAEELLARGDSTTARSIDHLLELAGETGTHSILDVTHLAARPEFAAAAPMLASDLRTIFGTDRPTREQAEDSAIDIGEGLQWQAY